MSNGFRWGSAVLAAYGPGFLKEYAVERRPFLVQSHKATRTHDRKVELMARLGVWAAIPAPAAQGAEAVPSSVEQLVREEQARTTSLPSLHLILRVCISCHDS